MGNNIEKKIREILKNILEDQSEKISDIGNDESLIDLGLDSMNSIEIIVEIEEELQVTIEIEELIVENIGTISGLIKLVESADDYIPE